VQLITEHDLRATASSIKVMPSADVDQQLSQLKDRLRSRPGLTELRQLAEQDFAELEQAAYELGRKYDDEGNLVAAARWFRVAAAHDYADASFELAKVLDRLAADQRNSSSRPAGDRAELDLVSEAARWYGVAFAAGHPEAADLLDALIARHDPRQPRTDQPRTDQPRTDQPRTDQPRTDQPRPDQPRTDRALADRALADRALADRALADRALAGHLPGRPSEPCRLGGLAEVMRCQLTVASAHIGTCRSCQKELLDHGGIMPASRKRGARG
jgi:hypothetical protein